MRIRVLLSSIALVLAGCPRPDPKDDVTAKTILGEYCQALISYRAKPLDLKHIYYAADIELRLYEIGATSIYKTLDAKERAIIRGVEDLLSEPSGRGLLNDATQKLFYVTQHADDLAVRGHALALLSRIFEVKRENIDVRFVTVSSSSTLHDLTLRAVYSSLAGALARHFDRLLQVDRELKPRLQNLGDALEHLGGYPAIKPEFAKAWSKLAQSVREDPKTFEAPQVELPVASQVKEGIRFKDRAVQLKAASGDNVLVANQFVRALEQFVFAMEVGTEVDRQQNRDAIESIPIILGEISHLVLADK